jgi:RNA polymerase sigma-70 factor (ECF subfamily)
MSEQQTAVRKETDEALIAQFQEGRNEAFNLLVGRYKDQLMNFVYRYLGNYDEADDVVQETFVRLYRNKDSYKPVAKFSTWLYTIATNLAKTQYRRRKRRVMVSLTRQRGEDRDSMIDLPDISYAADKVADSSLQQEIIQKALNAIPEKYREIVIFSDIQEMSYEEISEMTGVNIGTVKSRLNRGRTKLQELLKDLMREIEQ